MSKELKENRQRFARLIAIKRECVRSSTLNYEEIRNIVKEGVDTVLDSVFSEFRLLLDNIEEIFNFADQQFQIADSEVELAAFLRAAQRLTENAIVEHRTSCLERCPKTFIKMVESWFDTLKNVVPE